MIDQLELIKTLGFLPKENASDVYYKSYPICNNYPIEIDFNKEKINYGSLIISVSKTTANFSQAENWVVLECVNRLLEKGYQPKNIILEKTYPSGHGHSGRLDICVNDKNGKEYLLIECKTYGKEFEQELSKTKKNGGQLFSYFKFENKATVIMLYASQLNNNKIDYCNEMIEIEDDYRSGGVKDFYERWNKITKDNGIFDDWVKPYQFISKALTPNDLVAIKEEDSSRIFNQFLEILRHNVVSDKPNAFNKIFTLFLCKVYDEKSTKPNEQLKFQWLADDDDVSFQLRLTDLYKNGMKDFLDKEVTDFSDADFNNQYPHLTETVKKTLKDTFTKLRLEKNNEFAIKEVFDNQSFVENAKIVKEVVELLQKYKLRYNKRQQYLSDFFEMLLTTGLKQESGQFFTPVPIAQFIIKSLPFDKRVNEKLAQRETDNLMPFVMDYAAGSGHFLTESMHEMQRILDTKNPDDYLKITGDKIYNWQRDNFEWAEKYVYGIEKDYRLVKVGKVGCYLHGDGLANVLLSDGLASFKHPEYKGLLKKTHGNFLQDNKQFDIVISNPPYSVSSFKNSTTNYYNNKDFELYNALTDNSSEIECLFVERTKQLLKDDGIAGVILPSSILSNTGIYSKTRAIIFKYFKIIAITELGSNTFMATGTNTVVLFLKRRNNYQHQNIQKLVVGFFDNLQDLTMNGVENPVRQYIQNAWQGIDFEDYKTLLQKSPNKAIQNHDLFQDYQKIKAKDDKQRLEKILKIEQQKLFYFVLAYPQKIVLVKTGDKKAEKQFLGYEFSNRRGSEGLHPIRRDKSVAQCTQLFDEDVFDNPQKASTYIYQAFNGDLEGEINSNLTNNISRVDLVDLMTFDRIDFEKTISLSIKKKLKIDSQWQSEKLELLLEALESGKRPKGGVSEYKTGVPSLGGEHIGLNGKIKISIDNIKFVPDSYYKKTKQGKLKNLDIIICKDGALTGKIALFKENEIKYPQNSINEHIFLLRANAKVLQKFLFNILYLPVGQALLKSNITGQAQGGLNRTNLLSIKIPIPPKDIQQKIVDEIEVLEKQENKATINITNLRNSISDIISRIDTSNLIKLKQLMLIVRGASPRPIRQYQTDNKNGVNWIKIGDVDTNSKYITKTKEKITPEGAKKSRFVDIGDFILSNSMSFGRPYIMKTTGCIHDGWLLMSNFSKELNKDYLYYILSSGFVQEQFKNSASGGTTVDNLNITKVANTDIPLIKLLDQQKIVKQIEKIEAKISQLETEISAIPKQKEQILKKYL